MRPVQLQGMYVRWMRLLLPTEAEQVLPASRRIEQPRRQKRSERYACVELDAGIGMFKNGLRYRPHFTNTDGTSNIDHDSPYTQMFSISIPNPPCASIGYHSFQTASRENAA